MKVQSRWKSPVLWASIVSQIVSILLLFKIVDLNMGETINQATGMILQLMVLVGVMNDPKDPEAF